MLSCYRESWSFRDLLFKNWTRNLSVASKFYCVKSVLVFYFIYSKKWNAKKLMKICNMLVGIKQQIPIMNFLLKVLKKIIMKWEIRRQLVFKLKVLYKVGFIISLTYEFVIIWSIYLWCTSTNNNVITLRCHWYTVPLSLYLFGFIYLFFSGNDGPESRSRETKVLAKIYFEGWPPHVQLFNFREKD